MSNPGGNGRGNARTVLMLLAVIGGMGGMAWAAVPLYDLFCRLTGYEGTPQVARAGLTGADRVLDQMMTVRFDGSTAAGMPWHFRPEKNTVRLHIGETALAFYEATNPTDRTVTGTATFNVWPPVAGGYFVKVQCFCFTEQTLAPGETARMPVTFFVDPAIVDDPETAGIGTITLSYTFFEKSEQDVAAERAAIASTGAARGG